MDHAIRVVCLCWFVCAIHVVWAQDVLPYGSLRAGEPSDIGVVLQYQFRPMPGDTMPIPMGIRFEYSMDEEFKAGNVVTALQSLNAEQRYLASVFATPLKPDRSYNYRAILILPDGREVPTAAAQFKTMKGPSREPIKLTMFTGLASLLRSKKPEELLDALYKSHPDAFVSVGDAVDYAHPLLAQTQGDMAAAWEAFHHQMGIAELERSTAWHWMKGAGDFRGIATDTMPWRTNANGDTLPKPKLAKLLFSQQVPVNKPGLRSPSHYRWQVPNGDAMLVFTESREYRSPMEHPEDSLKTLWGLRQSNWLRNAFAQSKGRYVVLFSTTPIIGPSPSLSDDHVVGYKRESDAFFKWLREQNFPTNKLVIVAGGTPWPYHSVNDMGYQEVGLGPLAGPEKMLNLKPNRDVTLKYQDDRGTGYWELTVGTERRQPTQMRLSYFSKQGELKYSTQF